MALRLTSSNMMEGDHGENLVSIYTASLVTRRLQSAVDSKRENTFWHGLKTLAGRGAVNDNMKPDMYARSVCVLHS